MSVLKLWATPAERFRSHLTGTKTLPRLYTLCRSGPVLKKHLQAKSSSELADLRENLTNNDRFRPKFRTPSQSVSAVKLSTISVKG